MSIFITDVENYCPHRHQGLQRLEEFYDIELESTFGSGYGNVRYCPVLYCDFVKPVLKHTQFSGERDYLIYMTAARLKAVLKKFVAHFIGDGK